MEEGEGKIRSFVAVDLAPAVAAHVRDFLAACRALKGDIRWVRAEGLHVTLKFLGWTPADIVERVRDAVAACARGTGPLPARVRGLGGFPSLHRARVLWVGLEAPGLAELAGAIDHAVAPLGVEPERRPFAGHITVGRVGGTRGWHRVEALFDAHRDDVFGDCCFEAVTIYRSTLRPDGAVYTPLWQIPLSGHREGAIA